MRPFMCVAMLVAVGSSAACSRDTTPAVAVAVDATDSERPSVDAISGADTVSADRPPVHATAPSGARPAPAKTDTAVVVAELASREGPIAHCGVLYVTEGMQFDVVSVDDGAVGARRISVAVGCPEMPPGGAIEQFELGQSYRLRLSQRYPDRVRSPAIDAADYWLDSIEPAGR